MKCYFNIIITIIVFVNILSILIYFNINAFLLILCVLVIFITFLFYIKYNFSLFVYFIKNVVSSLINRNVFFVVLVNDNSI